MNDTEEAVERFLTRANKDADWLGLFAEEQSGSIRTQLFESRNALLHATSIIRAQHSNLDTLLDRIEDLRDRFAIVENEYDAHGESVPWDKLKSGLA